MGNCEKCRELTGMYFKRQYFPADYLHGKRNSKIWIIGINPYGEIGENSSNETIDKLVNFKADNSYFKDFRNVSERIYNALGKDNGVAHTDLVKCFSKSFPPVNLNRDDQHKILCNCREYLKNQLETYLPKIIICNGIHVVYHIKEIIPVKANFGTYYIGAFPNEPIVFFSGFIGRIDNFSKRRLGKEIEKELDNLQILI